MSTFGGLEIAKRALQVQKKSLEVTGHNIANANTEGYSRQRAIRTATDPLSVSGAGQVGTGVKISQIKRIRSEFVDQQIRQESSTKGMWEMKRGALKKIELIFNEPSDKGLRNSMGEFFNSLEELNNRPESKAVRATVRQKAKALTNMFNHLDTQLEDYQGSLNRRIKTKVEEINSYGQRIADLNKQIVAVESNNQNANDLRDKRNLLVKKLSKLTNTQVQESKQGALRIGINGTKLVIGDEVNKLEVQNNLATNLYDVQWKSGNKVQFKSGELKGLLAARDVEIPKYRNQLDNMAQTLVADFNTIHQSGYGLDNSTGNNFLTGTTAENIALANAVKGDSGLKKIAAASSPNSPGDGTNALQLANLESKQIFNSGTASITEYYSSNIARLGVDSQRAKRMVDNQETLLKNLQQQQEAIAGVSLDEEMGKMIKFQHAYTAAANVTSTLDQMLGTLIRKLG
ncbi:flagellar hook-associated protein FlgK [Halobacteroides halobius DSM 5150]|uniref:Flagellar hook-associated protein 1 n=1 Tax=Halobacteroides halobius (strain ATCC 35273 / DSM 5150 / MD-1) TaxID=748449 RepID=L0KC70_HALHC|nr:flagellar hook-associated protein FlgK [Halobacteroides halobius]AGB42150.1 flagellar hook-associated protein FlgK [Halobacteroides halobius DSM 5150]